MISVSQTGSRRQFSTLDHIFIVKQLIRSAEKCNYLLVIVCTNFFKALDSVYKTALKEAGLDRVYTRIIEFIYNNAKMELVSTGNKY